MQSLCIYVYTKIIKPENKIDLTDAKFIHMLYHELIIVLFVMILNSLNSALSALLVLHIVTDFSFAITITIASYC